MKNKKQKSYAEISWAIEDIKSVRPKWTDARCRKWLEDNASHLADSMCEQGWFYIEENIGDEEEYEKSKGS